MKQIKNIFLMFSLGTLLISCGRNSITNRDDYAGFLQPSTKNITDIDNDIVFWQKRLKQEPDHSGAQSTLAGLFTKRFQYSGNIHELLKADSMYKILNQTQKHFTASVYRSLAANAVTQHQFREAKYYLDSAAQIGDKLAFTILQQSEVQLELGNLPEAKRLLKLYPQQQSFEALIRLAKIRDQEGKLEEAIELLELAQSKITPENDEESYIWLKSNLGDFYSHNGQLRKAYQCYLTVLQIEPENYHCLKGIAWLAFSHDKKTAEAKEILEFLKSQHPVPDYDLMLGEIASFENDDNASRNYEEKFAMAVAKKEYGFMYNKYLFSLYADEWNDLDKAFLIAKTEVDNRPTAESYSLLSWANFKKGNYNEALRIAKKYVEGKCFEPEVAYYLGVIYKKTGDYFKASKYFKEVKSSIFELGPSYISKLKS